MDHLLHIKRVLFDYKDCRLELSCDDQRKFFLDVARYIETLVESGYIDKLVFSSPMYCIIENDLDKSNSDTIRDLLSFLSKVKDRHQYIQYLVFIEAVIELFENGSVSGINFGNYLNQQEF